MLACVAILVSLIQVLRSFNSSTVAMTGTMIAFLAVWSAIMWGAPRLSSWLQFRKMPTAHVPVTMDFSDSGVHIRSVHTDSQVAWSAYVAWGEYKSVFVILPQPRIYVPIPKRAFTNEQVTEFREMLRRNIGKR